MRAYFFCVQPGPAENAGYEHGLVALAEGLRELGHEVSGNRSYWSLGNDFLIPGTSESSEEFDLVLVSHEWLIREGSLPLAFREARKPRRIYLDLSDGWTTKACTNLDWPADLVLRSHYNSHFRYGPKVKPWAFGLTSRMIKATSGGASAPERDPIVACNFRVGHPVRDRLTREFRFRFGSSYTWDESIDSNPPSDATDHALWVATGRRHNPAYFQRLKKARISLAFGGFFAMDGSQRPGSLRARLGYHVVQRLGLATHTLTQFDSWRFWESLVSGCQTVHGPLDAWGAQFPVQPTPGVHYWSFDGRNSVPGGLSGREWALEHYSPRPTAERLLAWLNN